MFAIKRSTFESAIAHQRKDVFRFQAAQADVFCMYSISKAKQTEMIILFILLFFLLKKNYVYKHVTIFFL